MNKANGGDGIPGELFKVLKYDAIKVLHTICQQIWKTQQWPQDWKRSMFIPIPKTEQCQRMLKLLQNCTHFTCQQGNAQNPSTWASTIPELRTSRCTSWIQKRQRNQRSYCQHLLGHKNKKKKAISGKSIYFYFTDYAKVFFNVYIITNCGKFLIRQEIPDHLTYLLKNLYTGQEATVRTRHGTRTMDWFQIRKGVRQSCIFSFLFFFFFKF